MMSLIWGVLARRRPVGYHHEVAARTVSSMLPVGMRLRLNHEGAEYEGNEERRRARLDVRFPQRLGLPSRRYILELDRWLQHSRRTPPILLVSAGVGKVLNPLFDGGLRRRTAERDRRDRGGQEQGAVAVVDMLGAAG